MNPDARLRLASALIIASLLTEWVTLRWSHPTAFVVFAGIGGLCLGVGVLLFLSTLLVRKTD